MAKNKNETTEQLRTAPSEAPHPETKIATIPLIDLARSRDWARALGVCPLTLRRAVMRGDLAVCRIGRLPYHSRAQIEAWLKRTTTQAAQPKSSTR